MADLNFMKEAVILLALIAFIGSAAAIALDEFGDEEVTCPTVGSDAFYVNTSHCGSNDLTPCTNSSGATCIGSDNSAYNQSVKGLDGVSNTTDFLDVIGTIIGVSVLIGLVLLAFQFGRR